MPASASIVVAAIAMPNRPANRIGSDDADADHDDRQAVASIDTARPWITLVPWPVVEA